MAVEFCYETVKNGEIVNVCQCTEPDCRHVYYLRNEDQWNNLQDNGCDYCKDSINTYYKTA